MFMSICYPAFVSTYLCRHPPPPHPPAGVDDLKEVAKSLRSLPYVRPDLPTLALVGAPNVGKSSLVNILSSGTPEVCNYPFTTRSIKMGHFYVGQQQHQVQALLGKAL